MLRAKRRRTKTHDKAGNLIFNTMNTTHTQSIYKNVNNNLKQSICCNKTIACQYDNCGTVTYVPENITISIFGPTTRDPDLIIDGVYVLVPDLNTSPVYYNKDKNLYLGVNKGDISSPPLPHPPGWAPGRYWGIGHNYPSSNTAKWYFMYTNGNLLNEYSTDLYKQGGALLWSMGVATDDMLTDIKPNFVVTIKKSEQYKCCLSSQNRNPIIGYRKQLDCTRSIVSDADVYKKLPTNTVYKDNYAKKCDTKPLCYPQTKPNIQNRNGWVNDKYNYNTNQYLERRGRSFEKQAFNFLSKIPINSYESDFYTGCLNLNLHREGSSNHNCKSKEFPIIISTSRSNNLGLDCSLNSLDCTQTSDSCAKKGYTLCEATNNNCKAVYKRNNPKFSSQGAVSGGSRINRLKYQTRLKAQSVQYPSKPFTTALNTTQGINATNGTYPVSFYRSTYPQYKSNQSGLCLRNIGLTLNNKPQRCKMPPGQPTCRVLQTLPEKCHFKCAPNVHHNCRVGKKR